MGQVRVAHAVIEDQTSDHLVVTLDRPIQVSGAAGFRLVGGVARIKELSDGGGTNRLTFSLTDHALPDDAFVFLHWPELSDARSSAGKLGTIEGVAVENRATVYHGAGRIHYVSASAGDDDHSGTTPSAPGRSITQAVEQAAPGDYVLLQRGDRWSEFTVENKHGASGAPITIAAYGTGGQPVISVTQGHGITLRSSDYIHLDNLHVIMEGSRQSGIIFTGTSRYPVVSNSTVEGSGQRNLYGIDFGDRDGARVVFPQVLNNVVRRFRWNIRSSGYPYDGTHHVEGGLIENNVSAGNFSDPDGRDGISAQRGNFHGLVIRKNEVFGYVDDGMDFFAADNVIVEFNTIHHPRTFPVTVTGSGSGNAIKAGGLTSTSDVVAGKSATNVIVRYNTIHDVFNRVNERAGCNGITTNRGSSGAIYGNLVFNVGGAGITIDGPGGDWLVHNNTVYNARVGLRVYSSGEAIGGVKVANNIFHGRDGAVAAHTSDHGAVAGENNLLLDGFASGAYAGRDDRHAAPADVFADNDSLELRSGSPAIDQGVAVTGYGVDRNGIPIRGNPDIGALEYAGP